MRPVKSKIQALWIVLPFVSSLAIADGESIQQIWSQSPHADAGSESFTHWDDDGMIPANCAACHAGTGFQDFIGHDGSTVGKVDKDHAIGSLVDCNTCHNDTAEEMSSVTFPSGIAIDGLESSVQCMVCHQGRSSTPAVNKKTAALPDDTVDESLGFINIHYRAAAATLYGGEVKGGYQYEGRDYHGRFEHVAGVDTCVSCHNAHSTQVRVDVCVTCHEGQTDTLSIRTSATDFDGNSNTEEGIANEIVALHKTLADAISRYSVEVAITPVAYGPGRYPYFFNDLNDNGQADADEAIYPNRYQSWTPRLLKAAYNYQFVAVDPGGYAHNPHYLLQLLYDSLDNLGEKIDIDMSAYSRP